MKFRKENNRINILFYYSPRGIPEYSSIMIPRIQYTPLYIYIYSGATNDAFIIRGAFAQKIDNRKIAKRKMWM